MSKRMYDIEIAKEFGIPAAIILENIYFWIQKNQANGKHFHDGYYWTYNSAKAYEELFPELSKNTIIRTLEKLKDNGIILVGNYNENGYDRTKWYTLTHFGQMHFANWVNGDTQSQKPIPDNNTNIINNNNNVDSKKVNRKDIEEFFGRVWKLYPRKEGKSAVKFSQKKRLFEEVGEEKLVKAIQNYINAKKNVDPQYLLMGSTFFNGRFTDFLDDDIPQDSDTQNSPYYQ